ncbi:hypothetical protein LIPSTDRAFT_67213 [Lipomyces starkeyi NRRL Y-11557]|uniref:Uncharacterized protein n=1 Tax=Lipomyces starkeyi NRRL Y-11557 TaxID=675824 RepID=A0A1E3QF77_LIPST|nr:hypothetical protein LIPSTDRAFT_67213 [Lipomyces starkeyi NRRL Y-11557]
MLAQWEQNSNRSRTYASPHAPQRDLCVPCYQSVNCKYREFNYTLPITPAQKYIATIFIFALMLILYCKI